MIVPDTVNIGVATALEGKGLVVPVVRNVQGLSLLEIARELGISYRTVEVHRRQILRKTGASSLLAIAGLTSDVSADERVTSRHPSSTPDDTPPR